jgi:hypothetical protein
VNGRSDEMGLMSSLRRDGLLSLLDRRRLLRRGGVFFVSEEDEDAGD